MSFNKKLLRKLPKFSESKISAPSDYIYHIFHEKGDSNDKGDIERWRVVATPLVV